jgi:hypothetical protein
MTGLMVAFSHSDSQAWEPTGDHHRHQTREASETYFECITTCSLDDGECVTRCVEQLRDQS